MEHIIDCRQGSGRVALHSIRASAQVVSKYLWIVIWLMFMRIDLQTWSFCSSSVSIRTVSQSWADGIIKEVLFQYPSAMGNCWRGAESSHHRLRWLGGRRRRSNVLFIFNAKPMTTKRWRIVSMICLCGSGQDEGNYIGEQNCNRMRSPALISG